MSERSQLGQVPIPGENPAGESLSGDEEFDQLRAEVSRDPVLGVPVDWKVVSDLAGNLLANRSKDFAVACYLAVGLANNDGLPGLRDGLRILVDLIEHYWETAFPPVPKRLRGRANAIAFLSERSAPILSDIEPKLSDAESVSECDELLKELERVARERFGEHEVPLGDLTRALRELTSRVPAPAAPASVSDANSSGGAAASGQSFSGEFSSRGDVESLMLRMSTFLKQNDAQDPLGYRLPRILDFGDIASDPPDDGGNLMIPGPEAHQISGMRTLWSASDWLGLIETADNVCRDNPLSLDAQRFCSEGLAALGGPYQAAADGIRDEVMSLLKRAPRLLRLNFSDGTPLADSETQEWLQDQSTGPDPTATVVVGDIDPAELDAARTEARELARKGELPAALSVLEQTMASDTSPRGRFLGRLELAELCVSTGHDRVALPMLAELDDTLQKHGLEAWEPALSRRLLELYYRCRKRRASDDTQIEEVEIALARAEKLYERLCIVDPVAAAALE